MGKWNIFVKGHDGKTVNIVLEEEKAKVGLCGSCLALVGLGVHMEHVQDTLISQT